MLMKALSAASHVVALAGLYFASRGWFAVLSEGLHASHVTGHRLGLAGQALCNVVSTGLSPVMNALALCLVVTLALVVVTQARLSQAADAASRFVDGYLPGLAIWLTTMLALTTLLWYEDFRYIPAGTPGDPRPWALFGVPTLTFLPGMALAVLYRATKRGAFLRASAVVPLLAAVLMTFAFPARTLEETWKMTVQTGYPRPGWVLGVTGGLLAAHLVVSLLLRRATPWGVEISALVLAGWGWFLMSVVVLGAMMPHHILLLAFENPYAGVQEPAIKWMPMAFALLWATIGSVQWIGYRARAH